MLALSSLELLGLTKLPSDLDTNLDRGVYLQQKSKNINDWFPEK